MAFNYKIKEHIATLSENGPYATEVNLISYNGAEPKLDIRKWDKSANRMLKGIALDQDEAEKLKRVLMEWTPEG